MKKFHLRIWISSMPSLTRPEVQRGLFSLLIGEPCFSCGSRPPAARMARPRDQAALARGGYGGRDGRGRAAARAGARGGAAVMDECRKITTKGSVAAPGRGVATGLECPSRRHRRPADAAAQVPLRL